MLVFNDEAMKTTLSIHGSYWLFSWLAKVA